MANNFGGKIVTSGLVLALDASAPRSYDGSGTVWSDLSGNGLNSTLSAEAVGTISSSLNTMAFNGSSEYISMADTDSLNMTNISVGAWFNIGTFPAFSQYRIINHQETSVKAWGLQMGRGDYVGNGTDSEIRLFCHANDGISSVNVNSGTNLSIDTWYYAMFTSDGTTLTLYLNGAFDKSGSPGGNLYSTISAPLAIGVGSPSLASFFWDGMIGGIQIYNKALTATEVLQNYNATKGRFD